jgi:hypothetical protein
MASTNRAKTSYVAEITKGSTPASPAFKTLRLTKDGIVATPNRVTSNEIRADRQIAEQILVALASGGEVGIELSFNAFDDMLEAALQGAWTNNPSITVATIDTEISDLSTTTATVAAGLGTPFKAGHLVFTGGFPTAANNGFLARVASSTSTTVVFPAATFTAETESIPVSAFLRVVGFQGVSGDIVATVTGGNGMTSTALDFTTLGLSVGQWIKVGGDSAGSQFATAALNGWCRVSAITANRLSFDIAPIGWVANAGTSKTVQVFFGDFLTNGTTQKSFTFERQQQDIAAPSYEYFAGQQVNTFALTLKAGEVIAGSIGLMGMSATVGTSRTGGATDKTAPAFPVLNAASNVGYLAEGGVMVAGPTYVTELGITINNNLGEQKAVNSIYPVGVRNGEISVSGNLNAYFGDISLLSKVLSDTDTSLMFRAGRADGNRESILIDIPAAKLSGTSPVEAKNQDRMFTGTYAAKMHATLGYTITAQRYWYLPVAA